MQTIATLLRRAGAAALALLALAAHAIPAALKPAAREGAERVIAAGVRAGDQEAVERLARAGAEGADELAGRRWVVHEPGVTPGSRYWQAEEALGYARRRVAAKARLCAQILSNAESWPAMRDDPSLEWCFQRGHRLFARDSANAAAVARAYERQREGGGVTR